jgi:hypothetical protein
MTDLRFVRNVIIKGLALFVLVNLVFAWAQPLAALGRLSAYNRLFPGRLRLPYADDPSRSYSLSLFNLEAMFASHEIEAGAKPAGEYRVVFIGDSSTWGYLLPPTQTPAAYINAAGHTLAGGRRVRAYNLGYPVMSLTKDLLILSYAMRYQPDLIVWPLTLESFPNDKQLFPPLLLNNPGPVGELIQAYGLNLDPGDIPRREHSFWGQTLAARRRDLADLLRLQLYGPLWAATGIDQNLPETYTPRLEDLSADLSFHDLQPPRLLAEDLAFDVLEAGLELAGETPVLLVNEPMFISHGQNSDLRYNFFFPRWAYDDYRQMMAERSQASGWNYIDLWNRVPATEFTNSAVHMTPEGTELFARLVGEAILKVAE